MSELNRHVTARTIAGVRWGLLLNLLTIPLSFCTNMILGRTSADALGYYSAILIFQGSFHAFLVPGGREVFTRFVPALDSRSRLSFTLSYLAVVLAWFVVGVAGVSALAPSIVTGVLEYFHIPGPRLALSVALLIIVWAFTTHFLFSTLEGPRAAVTMRGLMIGFFIVAVLGWGPLRSALRGDPAGYLWRGALAAYATVATIGLYNVSRVLKRSDWSGLKWTLPEGFAPVVLYTHLSTVVTFVYTSLVPSLVLLWLNVASLGRIHAALRYGVLLNSLPVLTAPVLAPGIARLEASGQREIGLRHAYAAIRGSLLLIYPASIALVFFAGDAMAVFNPEFRENRDLLRMIAISTLAGPMVHLGQGVAAALGEFRGYLIASLVYVVSAVALTAALIPAFGLRGAALAATLGPLIQQVAVGTVLRRRVGFRTPSRVGAAWGCGVAATATALLLDPGRWAAAGLWLVFMVLFAVAGRVTRSEVSSWMQRLLGRSRGSD